MMMLMERPQVQALLEEKKVETKENEQVLRRLPVLLFGKLPADYKEDPMDPAGTAD